MTDVKVGDVVVFIDGSFTLSVIDGKTTHEFLNCGENQGRQYKVVAVNCQLPSKEPYQLPKYPNDTVIQDVLSDKVVFTYRGNLAIAKHKIIIDGRTIELSRESFLNLKRQLAG